MCGREMEGKGGRRKRVGGRLERASARGQVATKNQGTSEPPSSHARNLQLPPSRPKRYTYTRCFWGLGSIAGKPTAGAPSKSASLAWGMSDTRGTRQMRAVGQESKYYDHVAEGAGAANGPTSGPSLVTPYVRVNGARVVLAAPL